MAAAMESRVQQTLDATLLGVVGEIQAYIRTNTVDFETDENEIYDHYSSAVVCVVAAAAAGTERNRPEYIRCHGTVCKVKDYAEITVPSYSDMDFKSHFRMSRITVEFILRNISAQPGRHILGRPPIPTEKKLLVTLWLLGNQESYRGIADRFGITKSSAWDATIEICTLISERLSYKLKWPANPVDTAAEFQEIAGFPGVVGAIDGCHIAIKAPTEDADSYINRKSFFSINLMAVVDNNMMFTNIFAGFPGSAHDSRVHRRSPLFEDITNDRNGMLPNDSHLIGDSAFACTETLLTPYRDTGNLTEKQIKYNTKLSKTRCVVERAFGYLKCKWRRLRYLDMARLDLIPKLVLSACILHNVCLEEGGIDEDVNIPLLDCGDANVYARNIQNNKRDRICNSLRD